MVVKIERAARSSEGPHAYNQEKVLLGRAAVVHWEGMDSADPFTVADTFWRLEHSPSVRSQTRGFSFHASLDPSPEDGMDEDTAVRFASDLMARLGYGSQPWVMYRHDDIERTHWHLLSTRIRPDGSTVPSSHEGRRLAALLRELAPAYGYTVGRSALARDVEVRPEWAFDPSNGPVRMQLGLLLGEACAYSPADTGCLQAVLRCFGVALKHSGRGRLLVQGQDASGKPCTRPFSAQRLRPGLALPPQAAFSFTDAPTEQERMLSDLLDAGAAWEEACGEMAAQGIDAVAQDGQLMLVDHLARSVSRCPAALLERILAMEDAEREAQTHHGDTDRQDNHKHTIR